MNINSPWFRHAILYSLNIETFFDSNGDGVGDIQGLIKSMHYLSDLGITCIWLLPFYPSPLKDDGYDIADYRDINPRYGTMADFDELVENAHRLGIKIAIDLVFNHTSNQHKWFREARKNKNSKFRNYYIWSGKQPQKEEENVWTFDESAGEYYLHRFLPEEPDLDLSNPDVREEIRQIIGFWIEKRVSGFRIDVAHLLADLEQPATKKTRDLTILNLIHDAAGKNDIMFMAGAFDIPGSLQRYYGNGDRMNALFDFLLNQNMFLALAREEGAAIENHLTKLPFQPEKAQWLNFIRYHDEVVLTLLTPDEREEVFASFAPAEDMHLNGMAMRRRLASMMQNNRARMELVFSLVFSFPGIPMIRYGDEIGMGEDLSLPGRKSVRTVMQWNAEKNGGFSDSDPDSLIIPSIPEGEYSYNAVNVLNQKRDVNSFLNWVKKLIRIRKKCPEIGEGKFSIIETDNADVLVHKITGEENTFIAVHNLSANNTTLNMNMSLIEGRVLLADNTEGTFSEIAPCGYRWLLIPNKKK
jgi:maltose alpha-D-glucosyltransferase/alpha-amylase